MVADIAALYQDETYLNLKRQNAILESRLRNRNLDFLIEDFIDNLPGNEYDHREAMKRFIQHWESLIEEKFTATKSHDGKQQ